MQEELDLLDESARRLVEAALKRGAPPFVSGYEIEAENGSSWILEAAWPEAKVAALATDSEPTDERLMTLLRDDGWDARPINDWEAAGLVATIAARRASKL